VTLLPYNTTAAQVKALQVDGIMLSNGPGDPAENTEVIANLRDMMELGVPIFGICLGHQLLALASGAKTQKLKYGHRGTNQPVKDLEQDRVFVTSQNHGYAVMAESLPASVGTVTHLNVNDKTCEGVRYKKANAFTVQFHPEANGGPHDTGYLFDEFMDMMQGGNKTCR
jgi:carbamoyl-phosphate synthase small subunit